MTVRQISIAIDSLRELRLLTIIFPRHVSIAKRTHLKAEEENNKKCLLVLYCTSDTPHYENVPFEVPSSWVWCRLDDIVSFQGGYAYKSNTYVNQSDWQVIRIGNVKNDNLILDIQPVFVENVIGKTTEKYLLKKDDILFTMTGTKGKRDYFYTAKVPSIKKNLLLNQRVGCLRCFSSEINIDFLCLVLKGEYVLDAIFSTETGNVSQGNIGSESTLNLNIAIPPLTEQHRIVVEIEKWFALIDQIEQGKSDLQSTIKQTKSKILDLAIHGKLVPQDPNDEPAIELLKRINPGFTPCDNGHSEKFPYEIPETWIWCGHNSILDISGGAQPAKSYFETQPKPNYIRLYQIRDYGESPIPVYIPINFASKQTEKGDILLARYGGSLGKVFHAEQGAYNVAMAKVIFKFENLIYKEFAYYYYLSDLYQGKLKEISRTAQAGFNSTDFNDMYFPLPPINEQQRIVQKIETLFSVLDNIQTTLEV